MRVSLPLPGSDRCPQPRPRRQPPPGELGMGSGSHLVSASSPSGVAEKPGPVAQHRRSGARKGQHWVLKRHLFRFQTNAGADLETPQPVLAAGKPALKTTRCSRQGGRSTGEEGRAHRTPHAAAQERGNQRAHGPEIRTVLCTKNFPFVWYQEGASSTELRGKTTGRSAALGRWAGTAPPRLPAVHLLLKIQADPQGATRSPV